MKSQAERLREFIEDQAISPAELARIAKLRPRKVMRVLDGRESFTADEIAALREYTFDALRLDQPEAAE